MNKTLVTLTSTYCKRIKVCRSIKPRVYKGQEYTTPYVDH